MCPYHEPLPEEEKVEAELKDETVEDKEALQSPHGPEHEDPAAGSPE